jgi:hypothetical protein
MLSKGAVTEMKRQMPGGDESTAQPRAAGLFNAANADWLVAMLRDPARIAAKPGSLESYANCEGAGAP